MDVILTQDVAKLGQRGEVVRVKNGYARNYLFPRKLALKATPSNKLHFKEVMRQSRAKVEKQRASAQQMFDKINGEHVKLTLAFGETGKAYGSVTSKDIASAFREKDIYFDHHQVMLDHPLKEAGSHDVQIRLFADVVAAVKVWVVPEEDAYEENATDTASGEEMIASTGKESAAPGAEKPSVDDTASDDKANSDDEVDSDDQADSDDEVVSKDDNEPVPGDAESEGAEPGAESDEVEPSQAGEESGEKPGED